MAASAGFYLIWGARPPWTRRRGATFQTVQHVEFFHRDHFAYRYHRHWVKNGVVAQFIDFIWETDFESLWPLYPDGFSDALFPNVGYTYLLNLGTPFVMQLDRERFEIKGDGFLPRHQHMVCHHTPGNRIFGIKFRVSPVIFEKKIDFSEYREYIFPLAYLMDRKILEQIKACSTFEERVGLALDYYRRILERHSGSRKGVDIVTEILKDCNEGNGFDTPVEALAQRYGISSRTLQRYFEAATGTNCKQALQICRIRKAVLQLTADPGAFHFQQFGYYDYSHFYRHLKAFVSHPAIALHQPHLQLLKGLSLKSF